MKKAFLYLMPLIAAMLLGACSNDTPTWPNVNTFQYDLTVQTIAPEYVQSKIKYYDENGKSQTVILANDDTPVTVKSCKFSSKEYISLFSVSQYIMGDVTTVGIAPQTGIRFTLHLTSYDKDGKITYSKDFVFDNVHSCEPDYMPKLFPRIFDYWLYDEGDGKYSLRRN